jgi:hypothetical protein
MNDQGGQGKLDGVDDGERLAKEELSRQIVSEGPLT